MQEKHHGQIFDFPSGVAKCFDLMAATQQLSSESRGKYFSLITRPRVSCAMSCWIENLTLCSSLRLDKGLGREIVTDQCSDDQPRNIGLSS